LQAQYCCSSWEISSGPWSIRSTMGGPPATANTFSSSATSRSAVIERSTKSSSDSRVCSSTIDTILIALPSMVESNWKSSAHTTFGASATTGGTDDTPARFRGECTRRWSPSSRHSRCTFFVLIARPSSWRNAAQARRNPWHGCFVE
jgi:hypothetical protein